MFKKQSRLSVLMLILAGIMLSGCHIKKFEMPSWDVDLNVPLMNEQFYVSDLIDSVNFFPAPGNNIIYQSTGDIESDTPDGMSFNQVGGLQTVQLVSTTNVYNGTIEIGNTQSGVQLAYGMISQGWLNYEFSNMQPEVYAVLVAFWDIKNADGSALMVNYSNAKSSSIDLTGYHIGTEGSNTLLTQLRYSIQIIDDLEPGSPAGTLKFQLYGPIEFSHIRGKFSTLRLNLGTSGANSDIEYPGNIDQAINVTDTYVNLHIVNPSSFPLNLVGQFHAINENTGAERYIDAFDAAGQPYEIATATSTGPGITDIQFADSVDYLLGIMPTRIELKNGYFRNTNGTIGEIRSTDVITGTYTATAPFRFILYHSPFTPIDPVKLEITEDNRDLIRNNIGAADLTVSILNRIPAGTEVTMYFGTNSVIEPSDTTTWEFRKSAHAYAFTGTETEQLLSLSLTPAEVSFFTNPDVYMQLEFCFDASGGPVTITASPLDYVRIRSMVKMRAHIEE